jgi:hypothetical protein
VEVDADVDGSTLGEVEVRTSLLRGEDLGHANVLRVGFGGSATEPLSRGAQGEENGDEDGPSEHDARGTVKRDSGLWMKIVSW